MDDRHLEVRNVIQWSKEINLCVNSSKFVVMDIITKKSIALNKISYDSFSYSSSVMILDCLLTIWNAKAKLTILLKETPVNCTYYLLLNALAMTLSLYYVLTVQLSDLFFYFPHQYFVTYVNASKENFYLLRRCHENNQFRYGTGFLYISWWQDVLQSVFVYFSWS